jgi:hypothetical protein
VRRKALSGRADRWKIFLEQTPVFPRCLAASIHSWPWRIQTCDSCSQRRPSGIAPSPLTRRALSLAPRASPRPRKSRACSTQNLKPNLCPFFSLQAPLFFVHECDCVPWNRSELAKSYDNRDATVGKGFTLCGDHFDVHRFHSELIYGRRGDSETGEGIAMCRVGGELKCLVSVRIRLVSICGCSFLCMVISMLILPSPPANAVTAIASHQTTTASQKTVFVLITYNFPVLSARAVPQLVDFCKRYGMTTLSPHVLRDAFLKLDFLSCDMTALSVLYPRNPYVDSCPLRFVSSSSAVAVL